jgi:hypothetical protein
MTAVIAPMTNGMRQPQAFSSTSRQRPLQQEDHEHREQLAADQRDVLERRVEAALSAQRDLAHVRRGRAVFAADGQALDHACNEQQQRAPSGRSSR